MEINDQVLKLLFPFVFFSVFLHIFFGAQQKKGHTV